MRKLKASHSKARNPLCPSCCRPLENHSTSYRYRKRSCSAEHLLLYRSVSKAGELVDQSFAIQSKARSPICQSCYCYVENHCTSCCPGERSCRAERLHFFCSVESVIPPASLTRALMELAMMPQAKAVVLAPGAENFSLAHVYPSWIWACLTMPRYALQCVLFGRTLTLYRQTSAPSGGSWRRRWSRVVAPCALPTPNLTRGRLLMFWNVFCGNV